VDSGIGKRKGENVYDAFRVNTKCPFVLVYGVIILWDFSVSLRNVGK